MAHFVTTPSTPLSAPSECLCQLLKGQSKCLQITKSRGIKCCRPKNESLNDLPKSNCQELALLPEAAGDFSIDISQPRLTGFVDANKRDISSHLCAEHTTLNHCHSAVCNFIDVTVSSATSLGTTPMNALLKADQTDVDSATD